MKIEKAIYQGYVWFSDCAEPYVKEGEYEIDIEDDVNPLSRLVITFLPRSKCLLISWPQSPSAVILEPNKIKSVTVSIVSPSICHSHKGPSSQGYGFSSGHVWM